MIHKQWKIWYLYSHSQWLFYEFISNFTNKLGALWLDTLSKFALFSAQGGSERALGQNKWLVPVHPCGHWSVSDQPTCGHTFFSGILFWRLSQIRGTFFLEFPHCRKMNNLVAFTKYFMGIFVEHSVEISWFFCHSDFTWNQFCRI